MNKYKIVADVKVMGGSEGDVIEAAPHAMAVHLEKGEVVKVVGKPKKKIVIRRKK